MERCRKKIVSGVATFYARLFNHADYTMMGEKVGGGMAPQAHRYPTPMVCRWYTCILDYTTINLNLDIAYKISVDLLFRR